MDEAVSSTNRNRLHKQIWGILAFIIGVILVWHLYFAFSYYKGFNDPDLSISVNPLTNLVSITIIMPPDLYGDNPFAALGTALGASMVQSLGHGLFESEMNVSARKNFDLYAILIPYRVSISTKPASSEDVTRMKAKRKKRDDEEARAKAEAQAARLKSLRTYIDSNLSLEGVHVDKGENFGRTVDGVFGTIVNKGNKTINKVTVRFYFLNSSGQRIGETEFSPVLVSSIPIGDNTPLRPGYRHDFGFNVEKYAPSGWSKQVEAEIVDLEFAEK